MFGRKAILVVVTAAIGLSLLGGGALAAFAPTVAAETSLVTDAQGQAAMDKGPKPGDRPDKLKELLDSLVAKGVITQAQEDQILGALKTTATDKVKDEFMHRVFSDLFAQSATYLGMSQGDLKAKLPGTSLGAIADATTGKTRTGLVAYLNNGVSQAIAKLLADNKITKEQADKANADAPAEVAKFVDAKYPERKPEPVRGPKAAAFIEDANKVAREYLGLADGDLNAKLRSGKSLGEIADATAGKSRDGLIATLLQDANNKLDAAKAKGTINADQLLTLQSDVSKAINELVDRKAKTPAIKSNGNKPNANAAGAAAHKAPKR